MSRPIDAHEAELWKILRRNHVTQDMSVAQQQKLMADLIHETKRFASDATDREVNRVVRDPDLLAARMRLAAATAEYTGRPA